MMQRPHARRGLGRGLGALIPSAPPPMQTAESEGRHAADGFESSELRTDLDALDHADGGLDRLHHPGAGVDSRDAGGRGVDGVAGPEEGLDGVDQPLADADEVDVSDVSAAYFAELPV